MKQLLGRLFGKVTGSPDAEKNVQRSLEIDALEPRVLFSGAPIEPADSEVGDTVEVDSAEDHTTAQNAIALAQAEADATAQAGAGAEQAESATDEASSTLIAPDNYSAQINQETLAQIASAAAQRWHDSGLTAEQSAALDSLTYEIGNLSGFVLGSYNGANNVITIDGNASGVGWFIDATPDFDEEFTIAGGDSVFLSSLPSVSGQFDLLTVIMHEQGHALGMLDEISNSGVMAGAPDLGTRVLPSAGQANGAIAGSVTGVLHAAVTADGLLDVVDGNVSSITNLMANKGADGVISLREAIIAANNTAGEDTITLVAGTYELSITGSAGTSGQNGGDLDILGAGGNIIIEGQAAGIGDIQSIIDAKDIDRVFHLVNSNSSLELRNVVVTGGEVTNSQGAGVYVTTQATLTLDNVEFLDNEVISNSTTTDSFGGGFYAVNGATVTGSNVDFTDNKATRTGGTRAAQGGGFYANTLSAINLTGGTFTGNNAREGGGFLANAESSVILNNVAIDTNTALDGAGFYITAGATVDGTNVTIDSNTATVRAGGFRVAAASAMVTLTDSSIENNVANNEYGGGFYSAGEVNLINTNVESNKTFDLDNPSNLRDGHGAGFYVGAGGVINVDADSEITGNEAYGYGGGFWNSGGEVNLNGTTVSENVLIYHNSGRNGAGFWNSSGGVTNLDGAIITRNIVSLNGANLSGNGGGFYNSDQGIVNITGASEITQNMANLGGGFYNASNGSVVNITGTSSVDVLIDNNWARDSGGGFANVSDTSQVNLEYVTISNNVAQLGDGAGVRNSGGFFFADHTTITNNAGGNGDGDDGGGIFFGGRSDATITNSVISNNVTWDDGGGIHVESETIAVRIENTIIDGNKSGIDFTTATDFDVLNTADAATALADTFGPGDTTTADSSTFTGANGGGIHATTNGTLIEVLNSTITNNISSGAGGGIFIQTDTKLNVTGSLIQGNFAGFTADGTTVSTGNRHGGGIYARERSQVTIENSVIKGNVTNGQGGGFYQIEDSSATISGSTFDGNIAGREGGGYYQTSTNSRSNVTNTTITGNQAGVFTDPQYVYVNYDTETTGNVATDLAVGQTVTTATGSGVIIYRAQNTNSTTAGTLLLSNVTGNFTNNQPLDNGDVNNTALVNGTFPRDLGDGGGVYLGGGVMNLVHITVTGNSGTDAGGGVRRAGGTLNFLNSVASNNTGRTAALSDLDGTIAASTSFEGAATLTSGSAGTVGATNAGADSGSSSTGSIVVFLPQATDTNIVDQATTELLASDQTGGGRPGNGVSDLGSVELNPLATTVTLESLTLPSSVVSGTSVDLSAIANSTGAGDLEFSWAVSGGSGTTSPASAANNVTVNLSEDEADTFSFTHTISDTAVVSETITVTLTVTDLSTGQSVTSSGTIRVVNPNAVGTATHTFIVDKAGDDIDGNNGVGELTLREAISLANASGAGDALITFDAALNGTPLSNDAGVAVTNEDGAANGDLDITKTNGTIFIVGNGTANTIIDGGGVDRVFHILSGRTVFFTDLTITGGTTTADDHGAGFLSEGGTVIMTNVDIINNQSLRGTTNVGGGFYATSSGLNGSTIVMNGGSISGNVAGGHGGGFFQSGNLASTTLVELDGVSIDNNIAGFETTDRDGGGFYLTGQSNVLEITNSVISDNSTRDDGGGFAIGGQLNRATFDNVDIIRNVVDDAVGDTDSGTSAFANVSFNAAATNSGRDGGGGMVFGVGNVVSFSNGSTIGGTRDLDGTILDGNYAEDDGAGLAIFGTNTVNFNNTNISGNFAEDDGGGFLVEGDSTVNFNGGSISENYSIDQQGGGFAARGGTINMTGTSITDNLAGDRIYRVDPGDRVGGGFYLSQQAEVNLVDITITGNQAEGRGGGFYAERSTVNIISSTPGTKTNLIDSNRTVENSTNRGGAGFYATASGTEINITDATISNNRSADDGGGFHVIGAATVNLTNVDITANESQNQGGGFYIQEDPGTVTLNGVNISGNATRVSSGGGFLTNGVVTGSDVVVQGNMTGYDLDDGQVATGTNNRVGGGFYSAGAEAIVNLTNATIADNDAYGRGGGIYNTDGTVSLTNFIIRNNSTDGTANAQGGGIWNSDRGEVTLINGEISENTAWGHGGGIYQQSDGSAVAADNVTISGNFAGWDASDNNFGPSRDGGGIYTTNTTTMDLNHVTITGNQSTNNGGGILRAGGTVTVTNSILFGNFDDADTLNRASDNYGNITLEGKVILGSNRSGLITNLPNRITTNPNLGALADNGGFSRTHSLDIGNSVAIDAAVGSTLTEDQRGFVRSAPADLGSFEVAPLEVAGTAGLIVRLDALTSTQIEVVDASSGDVIAHSPAGSTTEINLTGTAGDDTLIVDFVNGNPFPAGFTINFDGGGEVTGDSLIIRDSSGLFGTVDVLRHNADNAHDGSVEIEFGGNTGVINYTGLEPITSTINANDVVLNFSAAAEVITVEAGSLVGTTLVSSTAAESLQFTNPANSLTINGGDGDDTISVRGLGSGFSADLIIDGNGDDDTVRFETVATDTAGGDITVTSEIIETTATVSASGGDITLTGNHPNARAVQIGANLTTTGTGAISITGTGGSLANQRGVLVTGSTTEISTVDGNILIEGSSAGDDGILIASADIKATGSGNVTLTGTGGNATGDSGVVIGGPTAEVSVASGTLEITGTSSGDDGVFIDAGGNVRATASAGTITIEGTSGNGSGFVGVLINGTNSQVTSIDGDITINGTSPGDDGVGMTNGGRVSATGSGNISITGTGGDSVGDSGVSIVTAPSGVFAQDGNIQITGTSQNDRGIFLSLGAVVASSGTGSITLDGDSTFSDGITITGVNTAVRASSDGNITIRGTGGNGDSDFGVELVSDAVVETVTGDISVIGNSSGDEGVVVNLRGAFRATGDGNVTLEGNTTSTSRTASGLVLALDTETSSQGGTISVKGTSAAGYGVLVTSNAAVTNTGTGGIAIIGTGGTDATASDGIQIAGASTRIETEDGNIDLTGTSLGDEGVQITGNIQSTGLGDITIRGTGDLTGTSDGGVVIVSTGNVVSHDGDILIEGEALDDGVVILDTDVRSTGQGDITIRGTSGGSGTPFGVLASNPGTVIRSSGGNILVDAIGAASFGGIVDAGTQSLTIQSTEDVFFTTGTYEANAISISADDDVSFSATATMRGHSSDPSILVGSTGTGTLAEIFTLDPATGVPTFVGLTGLNHLGALAYDPNTDTLFGVGADATNTDVLVTIDRNTGVATTVGALGVNVGSGGLAFDPNTNKLYYVNSGTSLYTINASTGAATFIGSGSNSNLTGLAFDPNTNTLYASTASGTGSLLTINPSNGQQTTIGSFGLTSAPLSGLAFDPGSNTLYLSDVINDRLFSVDTGTGLATVAGPVNAGLDLQGLAFIPGAPAASPASISITADADGDANGSGGRIFMNDGFVIDADFGTVSLNADEDITISSIQNSDVTTIISGNGAILDGGDTDIDVSGNALVTLSATGVGTAIDKLDTTVSNLEADGGSGGVFVSNTGNLEIGGIGATVGVSTLNADIMIEVAGALTVSETVAAQGGDIMLTGNASTGGTGVTANSDVTTSGSGAIEIRGTGGSGGADRGIHVNGSTTEFSTVDGDILLVGTSAGDDGIFVAGADVLATGTGSVDLNGTSTGPGSGDAGIFVTGATTMIGASGGTVSLTGNSDSFNGVEIGAATIANSAGGNIDITGTGSLYGTILNFNAMITSVDGTTRIMGESDGNEGVVVANGSQISATGNGEIDIDGTSTFPGGTGDGHGVIITSGGTQISTAGGNLMIDGSASHNHGVFITAGAAVTAAGVGNLSVTGTGGTNSFADGVIISSIGTVVGVEDGTLSVTGSSTTDDGISLLQAQLRATGSGDITVNGTSSGSSAGSAGVLFSGTGVGISANGGTVSLTGQGTLGGGLDLQTGTTIVNQNGGNILLDGNSTENVGTRLTAAQVSTDGTGDLTIVGTGGGGSIDNGVYLSGSTLLIVNGSIDVSGTSSGDDGVVVTAASRILATGTGHISLTGSNTNLINPFSYGVIVSAPGTEVSASGGDIQIDGTSAKDTGVFIGARVSNLGTGAITISGTGGIAPDSGDGVLVTTTNGVVTSVDGKITITGTAPDDGVRVQFGGTVEATGSGEVEINGTGGGGSGESGIVISETDSQVLSNSGNITLNGDSSGDVGLVMFGDVRSASGTIIANTTGLLMFDGAEIVTGSGDIDINSSDDIILSELSAGGDVFVEATSGTISDRAAALDTSGDTVVFDGNLTPGLPIGILRVNGTAQLADNSLLTLEIFGPSPGENPTDHDQIRVTGGGFVIGNQVDLDLDLTGFTPAAGSTIVLVDNDGSDAIVGTFFGLAEGTIISQNAGGLPDQLFQISYQGGDGNDVVLTALGVAATTDIFVDGSGNLVIDDIDGSNSDDQLSIRVEGSTVIINDPTNALGTLINGATQTAIGEVRIDTSLFNGNLIINTDDGNDTITLGSLTGLPGSVTIDGGLGQDAILLYQADSTLVGDADASFTSELFDAVHSSLTTQGTGSISIVATGTNPGSGYQAAIHLLGSDLNASGTGSLSLTGQGGDGGSSNQGVFLSNGSSLTTNDGDINITGTGGDGVSNNQGVFLHSSASISAGGSGNLDIDGQGGDGSASNDGIYFSPGSSASVDDGDMTLDGTAGNGTGLGNRGVQIANSSLLSSGDGDILIAGTGNGTGSHNNGVRVASSDIAANGTGGISLQGIASTNGTSYNQGVLIGASSLSTLSGDIDIDGTGGGSTSTNTGVALYTGASVSAGGSGNLSLDGTGGNGTSYNAGVLLSSASALSTVDGALDLNGTGQGSATGNRGIEINGKASVESTGAGNVTLVGRASLTSTGLYNTGIYSASGILRANSGDLTITGHGGTGSSYNIGARLIGGSYESVSGGLDIDGGAQGGTAGTRNYGVWMQSAAVTGGGSASVTGTGGGGTGYNHGVYINSITGNLAEADVTGFITDGMPTSEEMDGNFFP